MRPAVVAALVLAAFIPCAAHAGDPPFDVVKVVGGGASPLKIEGTLAYLCRTAALQVVDIADLIYAPPGTTPSQPDVVGSLEIGRRAGSMAVLGRMVYLVVKDDLKIVDARDPHHPAAAGSYHLEHAPIGVCVEGNYAYVAWGDDSTQTGGFVVVDVSDPMHPAHAADYAIGNRARYFHLCDHKAYISEYPYAFTGREKLYIVDVGDPHNPRLLREYQPAPYSFEAAGNLAVMQRNYSSGSYMEIARLGETMDVLYRDSLIFHGAAFASPRHIFARGSKLSGSSIVSVARQYQVNGDDTVSVVFESQDDVFQYDGTGFDDHILGDATGGKFFCYDISATPPRMLLSPEIMAATHIEAENDVLAITVVNGTADPDNISPDSEYKGGRLDLYDIKDRANPALAGTVERMGPSNQGNAVHSFVSAVSGTRAYIGIGSNPTADNLTGLLETWDISVPSSPTQIGAATMDFPFGIAANGNRIFALTSYNPYFTNVDSIDASDPNHIVLLGRFERLVNAGYLSILPRMPILSEGNMLVSAIAPNAEYQHDFFFNISHPSAPALGYSHQLRSSTSYYAYSPYACLEKGYFFQLVDSDASMLQSYSLGASLSDVNSVNLAHDPEGGGRLFNHLYSFGNETERIDISDPARLRYVDATDAGIGPVCCTATYDGYLYILDRDMGLEIVTEHRFPFKIAARGLGTTDPAPGERIVKEGETIVVRATSDPGWKLDHWEGGDAQGSTANPLPVKVGAKGVVLTAVFSEIRFTLSIDTNGGGFTTPLPGIHELVHDTPVDVSAVAYDGWRFDHWEGDVADPLANPIMLMMTDDKQLTAVFTPITVNLTTGVEGSGSVLPASGPVPINTRVSLLATPAARWKFDHWTAVGVDAPAGNPAEVTLSADAAVTAVFAPVMVTLMLAVNGQGTIDPGPGSFSYTYGTPVTITATPADGWRFDRWESLLAKSTSRNPLTLSITDNMALVAVFVPAQYGLTVRVSGQGTTNPAPGMYEYARGTSLTLTAQPADGWTFVRWDGVEEGPVSPAISLTVFEDQVVTAVFTQQTVTLTLAVEGQGTTQPAVGTHTTALNETVMAYASPADGWHFDHWTGAPAGGESANPVTVAMSADTTLTAVFEADETGLFDCRTGSGNGVDKSAPWPLAALLLFLKRKPF